MWSVEVNEMRVWKLMRSPAKARRSVTKLGRFAQSRGHTGAAMTINVKKLGPVSERRATKIVL
jgi:hypothetical protein